MVAVHFQRRLLSGLRDEADELLLVVNVELIAHQHNLRVFGSWATYQVFSIVDASGTFIAQHRADD